VARALGVLGAGVALALLGPFGVIRAGTTQQSTLVLSGQWPGVVRVLQTGKPAKRCAFTEGRNYCTYVVRRSEQTTLVASVSDEGEDSYKFKGWALTGIRCERTELLRRCRFTMPPQTVNATAKFGPKLNETHDPVPLP
jgi:hypothetical protein